MKTRKFTALLLVLCLLLTATPYSVPVHATEEGHLAQEQTQTQEETRTATETAETTTAPLAEGVFFQFVDQAVFQANDHIARIPEEETLSTYVFRNSDGTKTVYYLPDNVKYIAEDGAMVDKDLTLVSQSGGYGVARSDIQYLLPTSAASGIRMTHGNKQVTMYPQAPLGRATAATVSGDSVRYDNYFGSGIHLVYTPIPSGLKEDIVLDSYTGVNSFTFTLQTNGMRLYNDEGQYYFAASADAEERMYLGDIIVYDAKGEPSAGTLTVTPVTMGQQYTLTVSADPAFLTDPDTVYPVTIDPTLESRAESNTNFIEDATIYQNKPTTNAGTWTYNHCGYYASANTTYGVCRTAIRLAGIKVVPTWQNMSADDLVSAKFYIKEATGTAGVRFTLHNITNSTWTESNATWNTLANAYDATVSAEATLAYGGVAEFDFTALAKSWKSSNSSADCSFMLISSNTTVDKAFYSAEYGTPSYRPYVVITYNYSTNGLNHTSYYLDKGTSLRLTWSDVSTGITWTSSNSSVARVESNGLVKGIQIGRATITATADGYAPQTCVIDVTIPDGIHCLKNKNSGYFLSVPNSSVSSGAILKQQTQLLSEPSCFAQMWWITHLTEQYYSIRPVHKPTMALTATQQSVKLTDIGTGNPSSSKYKWRIAYNEGGGYTFESASTGYYLLPENHSTAVNTDIKLGNSNVSNSHLWSFILTDSFDDQVLLYDKQTSSYSNNITRNIIIGETQTLSQLKLDASFVSEDTIDQNLIWESAEPNLVAVNQSTGTITAIAQNSSTTITVREQGSPYSKSYTVNVIAIPDGIYYMRNCEWNTYLQIDGDDMQDYSTDGAPVEIWPLTLESHQRWEFTRLNDGYYKITSAQSSLALSVESAYANSNNRSLVQRTYTGSDTQRWQITPTEKGYIIRPKSALNYTTDWCMSAGTIIDTDVNFVVQKPYQNDSVYEDEWYITNDSLFYAELYTMFDSSYSVFYDETQSESIAKLNEYTQILAERFGELLNLVLVLNTPTYYVSELDNCKGTVTAINIDSVCAHEIRHDKRYAVMGDFQYNTLTEEPRTYVLWSCHRIESISYTGMVDLNRCCSYGLHILMLERSESDVRDMHSLGILMHEMCHQLGARDHYHEPKDPDDQYSVCKHGDICSECGENRRPASCIMNENRIDITQSTVLCEECIADIIMYLVGNDKYHYKG